MSNIKGDDLEEYVIGRSKSPKEIEEQSNRLSEKYNEIEGMTEDPEMKKKKNFTMLKIQKKKKISGN